ncbi:MAG: hypothetical protein ACE5D4_09550 [Thermodesulfobacteriota bacterium]
MHIDFTREEYRALVELLEISDWILHAHKVGKSEETDKYSRVMQKVYADSKEMGCSDLVEYNEELDKYITTYDAEISSESRKYIDEFEEDTFWEELISRLAERDAARKCSDSSLQKLPGDKRLILIAKEEALWAEEMEEHGLKRLEVVKN